MEVNKIYNGVCLEVLKTFPDNYIDSCVTDPPYGISFMNKHWDYDVPKVEVWKEIYRVLKPGAHVLCACGTRTQHRMAVNIEDAGFEIRDVITWHYGSGFPKSLDISKNLDRKEGIERDVVGKRKDAFGDAELSESNDGRNLWGKQSTKEVDLFGGAKSELAKEWEGWGTALKPATEFWTLARKPLSEKTVAENVLKYGTGGINIDGSRIETQEEITNHSRGQESAISKGKYGDSESQETHQTNGQKLGRFPANVIFDEFMGGELDKQTGILTSGHMDTVSQGKNYGIYGKYNGKEVYAEGDSGGASRFFYCPKADNYERNKGLKGFDAVPVATSNQAKAELKRGNETFEKEDATSGWSSIKMRKNNHPTVKPIDLMRYLVKLITPKKGICLDPYCGSGTTLIGCKMELINYIGIEREEEYCKIAEARVAAWNPDLYKPQTLFNGTV